MWALRTIRGEHISMFYIFGGMWPLLSLLAITHLSESFFHEAKAKTLRVSARVTIHLLLERILRYSTFSPLSLLINAMTGLSAGYRTNQCVPSHRNILDELRLSNYSQQDIKARERPGADLKVTSESSTLKKDWFWVYSLLWAEATKTTAKIFNNGEHFSCRGYSWRVVLPSFSW